MLKTKSRNIKETMKTAQLLAEEIKATKTGKSALVFALQGELGSGKTTFVQALAKALGIKEKITSPTFLLIKTYQLKNLKLKNFVHIDCYRLTLPKELEHLGFRKILRDKNTILIVEWADRVRKLLPRNTVWIKFKHGDRPKERMLEILNKSQISN